MKRPGEHPVKRYFMSTGPENEAVSGMVCLACSQHIAEFLVVPSVPPDVTFFEGL